MLKHFSLGIAEAFFPGHCCIPGQKKIVHPSGETTLSLTHVSHQVQNKPSLETPLPCLYMSMCAPEYLFENGETRDIYEFDGRLWDFRCVLCDKVATELHCQSRAHHQRVLWGGGGLSLPSAVEKSSPAVEDPLPAPWTKHIDPTSGIDFYHNRLTDESRWIKPTADPLPAPWTKHIDATSGIDFYYNPLTGESSWMSPTAKINWLRDARAWGLNPANIVNVLGGGPDFSNTSPARVSELSQVDRPPTYAQTTSFWGEKIYVAMTDILRNMVTEGGGDLWFFASGEDKWIELVVYSDCTKDQTRTPKALGDNGMWWPAIAVFTGPGEMRTWCQDFAATRSRKAWKTHGSRCHLYIRNNRPVEMATTTVRIEELGEAVQDGRP